MKRENVVGTMLLLSLSRKTTSFTFKRYKLVLQLGTWVTPLDLKPHLIVPDLVRR